MSVAYVVDQYRITRRRRRLACTCPGFRRVKQCEHVGRVRLFEFTEQMLREMGITAPETRQ